MKTWILRQNPCQKTQQVDMMQFIQTEKIITCPYGHIAEASDYVDLSEYNQYSEGQRTSQHQDRRFDQDMQIGDIVIIPFTGSSNVLIVRVESDSCPSKNFDSLLVVYNREKQVVSIRKNVNRYRGSQFEIQFFRPVYRHVSIISETTRHPSVHFPQRTLSQVRNPEILDWSRLLME